MKKVKLGAEPKKVAFLGVLLAVAAYLVWTNILSGPDLPSTPSRPGAASTPQSSRRSGPGVDDITAAPRAATPQAGRGRADRPALSLRREGEAPDPAASDPTLRLNLLARLREVRIEKVDRSLFDFASAPPAPKLPEPKIEVAKAKPFIGPEPPPPPPPPPTPTPKPPPPPLPFKFYGKLEPRGGGPRRAFLIEGEEILTPAEGETFRNKRYRIDRIGLNWVEIEDLQYQGKQRLNLTEDSQG
jgi:hypothetical protein